MASSSNIQHAVGFSGDHNREQFAHDQSIVRKIRVVVHTTGPWPNSPMSDNHVSVYLLLDNGRSVRINMTTQSNDDRGILYWTQLSYQQSNSAIIFFDYDAAAGLMVGHVYSMVREAGLHRYRFSGGGSGCRFWIYTLTRFIAGRGWVNDGVPAHVLTQLGYQYTSRSSETRQIQILQGGFLTQDDWVSEWRPVGSDEEASDSS